MSPEATPRENYRPVYVRLEGQQPAEVRMLVPESFAECDIRVGNPDSPGSVFTPLYALSSGVHRARLLVSMALMDREMLPGDIAERDLARERYEVVFRQDLAESHGSDSELQAIRQETDANHRRRTRIVRDGSLVCRLDWIDSVEPQERRQVDDPVVFESFKLMTEERRFCAEELRRWDDTSGSGLSFEYPCRTAVSVVEAPHERLILALPQESEEQGSIRIGTRGEAVAGDVYSTMRSFTLALSERGILCHGAAIAEVPPPRGFKGAYLYMPEAYKDQARYVVGKELIFCERTCVDLTFVWPSHEGRGWGDLVCRSAYTVIRGSLKCWESGPAQPV